MRVFICSLAILSLACGDVPPNTGPGTTPAADSVRPDTGWTVDSSAWARELVRLDTELDQLTQLATQGNDWTRWEQVASLERQRARLSGDWNDYDRAVEALDEAFAIAPAGSGPHRSAGGLDYTLHRFDQVTAHLDAAESNLFNDHPTQAGLSIDRALLHLQTGGVDDARTLIGDARGLHVDLNLLLAEALLAWRTGEFDEADRYFASALDDYHGTSPEPVAWLHLQRGLLDLDRGRDAEAAAHYRDADAALDGWWLVEEHLAELDMRAGRWGEAEVTLRHVVETTGGPEYMGMLAEIRLAVGDTAGAQAWADRATAAFGEDQARYPEAAFA